MSDVSRCLVAIGLKGLASPQLITQVEQTILPEVSNLSAKTLENLLFVLEQVAPTRKSQLTQSMLTHVASKNMFPQFEDFMLLSSALTKNQEITTQEML